MATTRATTTSPAAMPHAESGRVVAFRPAPQRRVAPRNPFEQRLARAGLAIAAHVVGACEGTAPGGEGWHTGTVIGILGTLAAEAALQAASINRRTAIETAPGGWVRGGIADTILFQDTGGVTTVWDFIASAAREAGVTVLPDLDTVLAHAEAHIGAKPYPALTVTPAARPRTLLRPAAARHRHAVHAFAADEGLCTPHEQALALGAAIAHVIATEDDPDVLVHLAAEILIGAARLAPMPYAAT